MFDLSTLGQAALGVFLVIIWAVLLTVIIVGYGGLFLIIIHAILTPRKGKTDGRPTR